MKKILLHMCCGPCSCYPVKRLRELGYEPVGYFFNPNYSIKDKNGIEVFKMRKMPSLFGRRFQVVKTAELSEEQESLILLSLMMMVLLERKRG